MKYFIATAILGLALTLSANAQYPPYQQQQYGQFQGQGGYGGGYGGGYSNPYQGNQTPFLQNYYNRNTQPLSPYLNLLRGTNPAVNYFYGVRPGLMQGAFASPLGGGGSGMLGRQTFFPQVGNLYDLEDVGPSDGMRPTGHPIGFSNTLNYYGAGAAINYGYGMRGQRATLGSPKPTTGVR